MSRYGDEEGADSVGRGAYLLRHDNRCEEANLQNHREQTHTTDQASAEADQEEQKGFTGILRFGEDL